MRPSSRLVTLWVIALCLLAVLFSLNGAASAQAAVGSKHKPSQQSLLSPRPVTGVGAAHQAAHNAPPPLTSDSWTGTSGDSNWGTAGNWNAGVPTSSDAVTIGTASATVNMNVSAGAFGTLMINSGDTLNILNDEALDAYGNITNNGSLNLNSSGNFTELVLEGNVTLSGGTVTMSNNIQNYIFGAASTDVLTNQETIQGAGQIGHGQMTLVNSGTINANQSAGITIQASGGATNTGTMEATGGELELFGTTVTNTGGTILANASVLNLDGSVINGGSVTLTGAANLQLTNGTIQSGSTLTNSATGTIEVVAGTNLLGGTINNSAGGTFKVDNGATLELAAGTYSQLGTLQLNSSGSFTELVLEGNVTLSGGTVTMSNNLQNYIFGAASTDVLTNQETIQGAGQIGHGQMTLVNSGTINANQSAGITIQASGGATNTGTMEATGGELELFGTTVTNTGGTILANASTLNVDGSTINGGTVTLTGAANLQLTNGTIQSGSTLTNSATGTIEVVAGTNLLGGTINNSAGGTFKVDNGAILELAAGTYSQLGTLQLNSSGSFTELVLEGNVTLSGGTVTMSNNLQNYIFGAASTDVLTNQETIQGAGQIGHGQMTLVNSGTINANQSAGITIQASGGATNTGTMEATGGELELFGTTVTNTGGTILANASVLNLDGSVINGGSVTLTGAANLQLTNGTIQSGSTLTNSATGTIEVVAGTNLLGGTINNSAGGTFKVDNGAILELAAGTYSQLGTLQLNSSGSFTELVLEGNVTLSGGTVTMSNNLQNYIFGAASTDVLTNQETIQGAGQIGHGQMTLVNSGTINANQSAGITIQASGGATNTGTMEATGGELELFGTTVTNTGGTILANASVLNLDGSVINGGSVTLTGAANLQLTNGTIQSGSTLTNSATGTIEVVAGTNLLGGTINNSAGGTFKVDNGAILELAAGTYSQLGTLQLNSSGSFTELVLEGNVTLSGGTVTMSNNLQNYIFGAASTDVLTNQETIQGAGHIGNGQMGLLNSGAINANGSAGVIIDVSSSNFDNTGTVEATGGTLTIEGPGTTFFTNDNQTTNTLTGGTYIANGNNIQWAAGSGGIKTLAANVTEEGGGQLLNTTNSTNALANLTSITSAGALTIGGVSFTDAEAFSNAGSLTLLPGESFAVGSLSQISGGSLTAGTYVLDSNLNLTGAGQTITTNAATLTLAGGTIENANSTNALAGLAVNSGKLTIAGSSNSVSTTATSFSNTGTLTINSGDSFTAKALTQISGTTLTAGTYVLGGNLDLSTGTANITTNSATLTLEGGTIENTSNSTNALLNLATNTRSLTLANNANFTTTGNFTNTGTLTVNSGSTFTVLSGKALTNYKPGTNTLTAGTYVVGGTLALNAGLTGGIKTDSANITLEGTGEIENTTSGAPSTNALINLATIGSTGSFTLADNANFTAVGNFTNGNKLIVDSGSTFALTGSNVLTNLASGTLSGGSYTVGGTLQLTSTNGGITTNAATLTLTGTAAKILDGTTNALAGFNNNTGSLTLSADAALATANNFTNSGTVNVVKGSTLTVSGTGHSYTQTAGQTTLDGTLAGIPSGASITGGTILGAGIVKGNLSVGNATGTAATINVGDNAKAGLLSITGKYTQLATGTMTGLINGTAAGTGFSQLKVTGTAALAGTINFTVATAFQASLTLGETFTVLTSSAVSGTFSNSTIAINGTFQFNVSYTSTGVVLTVASATPNGGSQPGSQTTTAMPVATARLARATTTARKSPMASSGLRHGSGTSKIARPVVVAAWTPVAGHSNAILAGGFEKNNLRSWEHVPVISASKLRTGVVGAPRAVNEISTHLPASDLRMGGESHAIGVQSPLAGWMGTTGNRRAPVKLLPPMLPRISR